MLKSGRAVKSTRVLQHIHFERRHLLGSPEMSVSCQKTPFALVHIPPSGIKVTASLIFSGVESERKCHLSV